MAYRMTCTDKWVDVWFTNLSQVQMLLFMYLCDKCDVAGFLEINYKSWASDLSSTQDTVKTALNAFGKGVTFSKDGRFIFLNNFLKHQKNFPLNLANKAHLGIIRRFEFYAVSFEITDISEFIEGAMKGLPSPYGISKGNGKGIMKKATSVVIESDPVVIEAPPSIHLAGFQDYERWLNTKGDNVKKLKKPLTLEEYGKLIEKHGHDAVVMVLQKMNNYAPLTKKSISVYLTANNWLNMDLKRV